MFWGEILASGTNYSLYIGSSDRIYFMSFYFTRSFQRTN